MPLDNNATKIRREVLVKVAQLCFDGKLVESVDRLPVDMRPKTGSPERCCVHKERAIIKYRLMASMGVGAEEETDECTSLSAYARDALARTEVGGPILTIIDEACSACIQSRYFITNACRGCFARPCALNCPKKCISFTDGRAQIDHDKCVNCGRCMTVCPYHAIIHIPIPCEEECPVSAIAKDDTGRENIDHEKCIVCGKCMQACPFGAIMERSQMVDVIGRLKSPGKTIAMIAPSIVGQFSGTLENIIGALKELGFDYVAEVAAGADVTAKIEAEEFAERMENDEAFMTTSCCTAYAEAVKKHVPELRAHISKTGTPMHYTAEFAEEHFPEAVRVFIGPCTAKRKEALDDALVDFVLTFEELGSMFVASGIDVEETKPVSADLTATRAGRGFPVSCGVIGAIESVLPEDSMPLKPEYINGITKQELKRLKAFTQKAPDCNIVEVMCCPGGCVAGPDAIGNPKTAARKIRELTKDGC